MQKIAFMFPGVGSQYVGLGKDYYDHHPIFRETIEEAGDVSGQDLVKLCFGDTPAAELSRLVNAQLAILAVSVGIFRVFKQQIGLSPHYGLGHSLGEYSALCCAGVMPFADAVRLVQQRGAIVNEAAAQLDGTMAWVVNLETPAVERVCRAVSEPGAEVFVSAYDSPTQTSISGHTAALMKAARALEGERAIVYPLKFSGPFHCPLMRAAAEKMSAVLRQYTYGWPQYSVIANCQARPYTDARSVVDHLASQLVSPIRWQASIDYLVADGVAAAVEVGPKNVLKFLLQKNTPCLPAYVTDKRGDLEAIGAELIIRPGEYLRVMGRCLGAAVGSKNRNQDTEEYARAVVAPYRKIEAIYRELAAAGKHPGKDQVRAAAEMLAAVLTVKGVPPQERQHWWKQVFRNRVLNV